MPSPERTIRKFNPGTFQSDAEVSEQFVVRCHELDITLEVLRDNIDSESCQHQLVIAPRGRGKTMLLARVAAELRANPTYSDKLLPVRFMEESHEVLDIGDFWLEALYYLAKECAASAPELARELQSVHAHLAAQWRDPRLRHRARATVLDAADRLDRQLVLMVENLQTLCEDADDDFGWELRESLQMEPKVMLLGTATSRFDALDDAQEAFFELFRITVLNPLDTEECGRLWEAVTGNEVKRDQIRPIEILTGGSPRLLVIVADFARHHSFRQLLAELVTLVDDHTEYFRGHLEVLPKTERRVYLATLALWRPSSTSEIAARARMGVRITSAMLGRLVDRGALVAAGGKRTRRYAAAERLYCIYYKIRRERDEAAVVQNLIRFMTLYYFGRRPADEVRRALAKEVQDSQGVLAGMVRAVREDLSVATFAPEAAITAYDAMIAEMDDSDPESLGEAASAMLNKAGALLGIKRETEARDVHEELVRRFGRSGAPETQGTVAKSYFNLGLAMQSKGDLTGAIGYYQAVVTQYGNVDSIGVQDTVLPALSNMGNAFGRLGKHERAMTIYDEIACRVREGGARELLWHGARALVNLGSVQAKLGRWTAAVRTWQRVENEFAEVNELSIQVELARALYRTAAAKLVRGSAEAALRGSVRVVDRFGALRHKEIRRTVAQAFKLKGDALRMLSRVEKALDAYRELQERFADVVGSDGVSMEWASLSARMRIHYEQRNVEAARRLLRASYAATDVENDQNVIAMHVQAASLAAARVEHLEELADVLSSDKVKSSTFWPLEVALRGLAGKVVRAPIEVMQVADDIREEVENLRRALNDMRAGTGTATSVSQSLARKLPRLADSAHRLAQPTRSP